MTLRTSKAGLLSALIVATSGWLNAAQAMSRMGEAAARLQDGLPCFMLSDKEVQRGAKVLLHSISVYDASSKPAAEVWRMSLRLDRPDAALPAGCILYGRIPENAEGTSALPLQTSRVYKVSLGGNSSDTHEGTQGYTARFCLLPDQEGGKRLLKVDSSMPAWTSGFCD